jgi:hypothetical protein
MYNLTKLREEADHIRPFLGIALVAAVALFVANVVYQRVADLTAALAAPQVLEPLAVLTVTNGNQVHYGDTVSYAVDLLDPNLRRDGVYVTTTCFVHNKAVFQSTAGFGTSFKVYDLPGDGLVWDHGAAAVCSAALLYRGLGAGNTPVRLLDAATFSVVGS